LFDLDKRMEEILKSKLPAHKKVKLYNEALQKSTFLRKEKTPPKKQKRSKTAYRATLLKNYKKQTYANEC